MAESVEWIGKAEDPEHPEAEAVQASAVEAMAEAAGGLAEAAADAAESVATTVVNAVAVGQLNELEDVQAEVVAAHELPEVAAPVMSEPPADAAARPVLLPRAREVHGERAIGRILRIGALASGGMFLVSLGLELLPVSETASVWIDGLQKAAASLLLVTPVARLVAAGLLLGRRGEWRYSVYAFCVLVMLCVAVGAGFAA